jgi:LEA14-like dessication related protein
MTETTLGRRSFLRSSSGLLVAAPIVAGSTGCATLLDLLGDVIKMPGMNITDMKVLGMTLTSISTRFTAAISNPNPIGFELAGLDWALGLAGSQMAKGRSPKGISVKARSQAKTDFEVNFDLAKTAQAVLDMIGKKSIPYTLDATGAIRANKYKFDVPLQFKGAMPMPTLPTLEVPTFKVKSAGLSGIKFQVDTAVTNMMPFAVPIDAFNFDVKVGGNNVLSNKAVSGLTLGAKQREIVPLEFNVDLGQLGLSVARLASNPRFDWEVGAELASGFLKLPFTQKGAVRL